MQKRGQVAIFVIIGVIIVIAFAILFFVKQENVGLGRSQINNEEFLSSEIKTIQHEVLDNCAQEQIKSAVKIYLENGGGFEEPDNYIKDNGKKYRILCQKIPNTENCLMQPLITNIFSKQLNDYIYDKIDNCIDFSEYEDRGYVINIQEDLTIDITITDDTINLNIKYPFTIERQGVILSSDGTQYRLALPVGDLFKAVNYILGQESIYGTVDIVNYQITNLNKYKMQIKKPYPDKLYEISLTDYP